MKSRCLTVLCMVLLPWIASAADPQPPDAAQAYQMVKGASEFSIGPVGVAGTISSTEKAYDVLCQEPNASTQFTKLIEEGTPAGQLYALLGLKNTDPAAFQVALEKLKQSKAKVKRAAGCILSDEAVATVAQNIAAWKK